MADRINILFVDLGNPISSFVKNRIHYIEKNIEVKTHVCVPNSFLKNEFVNPIILISKDNVLKFLFIFLINIFKYPIRIVKLWKSLGTYVFKLRLKKFLVFNSIVKIKKIDIVHIQWVSSVDDFLWVKDFFDCQIVASARGSQVTIYPYCSNDYEKHIRYCINNADYIHAVSESIKNQCILYGGNDDKVFVNYNGIKLRKAKTKYNKDFNKYSIITNGVHIGKGVFFQLQILYKLIQRGDNVTLYIIGDGEIKKHLLYISKRLNISEQIKFVGNINYYEVFDFLEKSDIYISTSMAEGLANSVLEAVSIGLPVIAFDCEGMKEIIHHEKNGYIVDYGDIDTVIKNIDLLKNDNKKLNQFSEYGQELVKQKFNADKTVKQMIDFYKKIKNNV